MSKTKGTGQMTEDLMARVPAAVLAEVRHGASLARLLHLDGVRLRRGPSGVAEANCPFPAHPLRSDSFRIDLANPRQFWCTKCGVKGGIEEYLRARFAATATGGWGEQGAGAGHAPLFRRIEREMFGWRAPAVDCVFAALLDRLSLYPEHAEFLLAKGISSRRLGERQFRSLPVGRGERVAICEELASEGYDLESLPGFFKLPNSVAEVSARGRWCFGGNHVGRRELGGLGKENAVRYEVGGILTPVRDRSQQIRALEVFNDDVPAEAPESLRWRWPPQSQLLGYEMGSGSRNSIGQESLLHFVRPETTEEQILLVTKGALRAEVMAFVYRAIAVAIFDLERQLEQVIEAMQGFALSGICFSPEEISETSRLLNVAKKKGLNARVFDWQKMSGCSFKECIFN